MGYMFKHTFIVIFIIILTGFSYASEDATQLIGTWEFGQTPQANMIITKTYISQDKCRNMPYNVLSRDGDTFYLSIKTPKRCKWSYTEGAAFLQLTLLNNGENMIFRMCPSMLELKKIRENPERGDTYCSWETVHKVDNGH